MWPRVALRALETQRVRSYCSSVEQSCTMKFPPKSVAPQHWGLVQRLLLQTKQSSETPLFLEEAVQFLRQDLQSFLLEQGLNCHANIADNQPLALDLLHGLLLLSQDIDQGLPGLLEHGVPTGIEQTIPASGVWPAVEVPERLPLELITCEEPWGSGLSDPKLLMKLVQDDVDQGFAEWLPGGLPEAKQLFGQAIAAGKLGLVKKEGSAPRLVGDSIPCKQLMQNS